MGANVRLQFLFTSRALWERLPLLLFGNVHTIGLISFQHGASSCTGVHEFCSLQGKRGEDAMWNHGVNRFCSEVWKDMDLDDANLIRLIALEAFSA